MRTIAARNVNDAVLSGIDLLAQEGFERDSRNGPVLVMDGPVTTLYRDPTERVLTWKARDANPFFHLYEALYMLTGNASVAPLTWFVKNMSRFSDDGFVFNGFYGQRWRGYFGHDQLRKIADQLTTNPDDRRCVLQMWDGRHDLGSKSNDVPCNTAVYFSINVNDELDMTVTNRSNDIVWGAYGANSVHMSMLQEYLAGLIHVPVGRYWQVSNNFHGYLDTLTPLLAADRSDIDTFNPYSIAHESGGIEATPLLFGATQDELDHDIAYLGSRHPRNIDWTECQTYFVGEVLAPAVEAYKHHKAKDPEQAMAHAEMIGASDWRLACTEWIERRQA